MKLIYFVLLGLAAWRDVPELWRQGGRREAAAWAALGLAAAALAGWMFWGPQGPGWAELLLSR